MKTSRKSACATDYPLSPHKQISDLHHVSTICQFLVGIQKHKVAKPELSRGWAQARFESL